MTHEMPERAMKAVMRKDRDAWLDCFAEDAVLRDPVGGSPLDPRGDGLVGRDALGRFWDGVVAPLDDVRFEVREEHVSGASVARVATVHLGSAAGEITYDGVFVYDLGADGRITELRGYFALPS